jgi:Domain of unknown function (DUF4411)
MAYLLDANVFIQAKNLHYGMDFCPAFWNWLVANNAAGRVFSIEKVGDEIEAGADELAAWAAQRGDGFFLKPDTTMLPTLGAVSTWATGHGYEPAAVNTFLQSPTTIWSRTRSRIGIRWSPTKSHRLRLRESRFPTRASVSGSSS